MKKIKGAMLGSEGFRKGKYYRCFSLRGIRKFQLLKAQALDKVVLIIKKVYLWYLA